VLEQDRTHLSCVMSIHWQTYIAYAVTVWLQWLWSTSRPF